ncbi:Lin1 family protein [Aspergillus campestris IBT 28561]|uniref:Lin1 family protein n=1 Tax=Aspergillus campestris (strain IBT 28561) TaxID=1392248 RepID=A0A2I1D4G0_ASPC2|nr:Lin1 family protein [Aspergillus campestris IBT 28561]PKY04750.1 Lin1 family protein [Aspergillus campestris IBT 28561]
MSGSQPRPKRAGEDFARTQHVEDDPDGPSQKKPRFDLRNPSALAPDALDDDQFLEADEIGRRGQQVRRKAVNLDGYESDSDNEGFDARHAHTKTTREAKDGDDDDDMFAELEEDFGDENADQTAEKNKKNVRFLQDDEIEGQVASSKSGGTVHADLRNPTAAANQDDSESESEIGEEDRARIGDDVDEELGAGAKKKHAPLLDAFNMRDEQEEGRFDEAGNYVRKAVDPDAVHDSWLEGVSKKDMRRAREAAEKREAERKEKDRMEDSVLTSDALKTVIPLLQRGETILDALARIGKGGSKKPKWQNKRNKNRSKQNGAEDTEMTEEDPAEVARKQTIDALTGAADILMGRGNNEIYDTEREILTRQYRRETGEEWVDPPKDNTEPSAAHGQAATMWQFRWADARDGGVIHGPYDSPTMASWKDAGYFGEGVEFRKADEGEWSSSATFV